MSTAIVITGVVLAAVAVIVAAAIWVWIRGRREVTAHGRYQRDIGGIKRSQAATLGFGVWGVAGGNDGHGGTGGGSYGDGGGSCGCGGGGGGGC